MSRLTFTPLHPVFAAECSGVDIGEPLSPGNAAAIQDGMDRYAVLVFRRGAPLTTAQQLAFTQALGELEAPYTQIRAEEGMRLDSPRLSDISNLGPGDQHPAARRPQAALRARQPDVAQRLELQEDTRALLGVERTRHSAVRRRHRVRRHARRLGHAPPRPQGEGEGARPPSTAASSRRARWASASPRARSAISRRCASRSCAPIRAAAGSRSTCPRTPGASSAGRCPRR